jgi:hypothetical protein
MDPIGTFAGTKRAISVAWKLPAANVQQAKMNLDKVNKLVSFLYPLYSDEGVSQASTINMDPYWQVKFGNLICNSVTGGPLLGWVNGITVDPIFEDGSFMFPGDVFSGQTGIPLWDLAQEVINPIHTDKLSKPLFGPSSYPSAHANGWSNKDPDGEGIKYFPKTIRLNFEMTVTHDHSLGWTKSAGTGDGTQSEYIFRGEGPGNPAAGISFPYPSERRLEDPIDETAFHATQIDEVSLGAMVHDITTAAATAAAGVTEAITGLSSTDPLAAARVPNGTRSAAIKNVLSSE